MHTEETKPDLSLLSSLIAHRLPEKLYHYTSIEGLIGIIETQQIWATHIMYMNDSQEFRLFVDLLRRDLELIKGSSEKKETKVLDACLNFMSNQSCRFNVCVASFSEIPDALDQYRGYGGPGPSFCIGFSFSDLSATAHESTPGFSMSKCVYERKDQRTMINNIISSAKGDIDDFINAVYVAPIFKDEAFKNEREWRLHATLGTSHQLYFRAGRSMMVPYCKFPLNKIKNLGIKEVIVGPTPNKELSVESVKALLKQNKIIADVKPSAIPFRSW